MRITNIEVKNRNLPDYENVEGWAVAMNGHLIAVDSYKDPLSCSEIASNIARVLGVPLEELVVELPGGWTWADVLPHLSSEEHTKSGGILVRYTGISGEAEFACSVLIPYTGDAPAEEVVRNYFSDFFCDGTIQEDNCVYYSADGCRAVRVQGWIVVPPADYAVLAKYI